jgi:hypothetical protein
MGYARVLPGVTPTTADLLVTVDDLIAAAARVIGEHGSRSSTLGVAVLQLETALSKAHIARSNVTRVVSLLKRAEVALGKVATA